jgi:hypothetical protein
MNFMTNGTGASLPDCRFFEVFLMATHPRITNLTLNYFWGGINYEFYD